MIFESREICERSATVVNPYLNRFDWGFPYKRRTQGDVRNSKSSSSDVRKSRPFRNLCISSKYRPLTHSSPITLKTVHPLGYM